MLTNAKEAAIQEFMAPVGYTLEKVDEVLGLLA